MTKRGLCYSTFNFEKQQFHYNLYICPMLLLSPTNFPDYELIDCGDFLKLERWGKYITIRPEPQAVWSPALTINEWRKKAHLEFISKSSSSGDWKKIKD